MTIDKINQVPFSDLELRNIVFNAMGRTSEAGNAVVFQLGYASNIVENSLPSYKNKNNSGFTLGHMQMDYAANPNQIPKFLDTYDAWAKENNHPIVADRQEATRFLSQNRNTVFGALKAEYNSWASENNKNLSTDNIKTPSGRISLLKLINDNQLLAEFQQTNPATKFTDIRINNHSFGQQLRTFLESDAGYDYVMSPQLTAYNNIEKSLQQVMERPSFLGMNHEEQVQVIAAISKIVNQNGNDMGVTKFLDDKTTFEEFKTKTLNHLKQENKVVHSGVVKTLEGVEVYNALTSDPGTLGNIFKEKLLQDPYLLTKSQFITDPAEQWMDTMFRYPDKIMPIINAVKNDGNIIINPTTWLPAKLSKEDMKSEVYAVGVKDGVLFSIYKDGGAHKMDDKGQWIAFDNNKNPLIHTNAKGEWTLTPRDLTQDHKGPDVLELQGKLNALGHPVTINEKEPTYDQATTDQVKAFQEANGLTASGKIDDATRTKIDQQLNEQNKHLPFVRSNDGLPKTEQQIASKIDEIDKLNDQIKSYDPVRDIGEIAKADADVGKLQDDIALLELNKNTFIDKAIADKQAEIEALKTDNPVTAIDESAASGAIPSNAAALALEIKALEDRRASIYEQRADTLNENNKALQGAIDNYDKNHIDPLATLQTKIDNNADTTFDSIKDELKTTGVVVTTPSGMTAEEFANLDLLNPKNGDEAKATQQYLYDQGAFGDKAHTDAVDGKWGSGSQKAVQQFLYDQDPKYFPDPNKEGEVLTVDKAVDGSFGTGSKNALEIFNQTQNDYLAKLSAEDLSKLVETEKTLQMEKKPEAIAAMDAEINANKAQIDTLEKANNELTTRQTELLDKGIKEREAAIEPYDRALTKLAPEAMEADSKNVYDHVKNDLAKPLEVKDASGEISEVPQPSPLLTESEKALFNKESIDLNKQEDIKALQQVFCDRGQLSENEVKGNFGPKTEGLVKEALGLDENTTIDKETSLKSADLITIAEKGLNDLTPEALSEKITALKTPLETEKKGLEQQKGALLERVQGVEKAPEPMAAVQQPENRLLGTATTGDPDLDRILEAALNGEHDKSISLSIETAQRPDMQELNQELLAEARQTNLQIAEQQRLEQQEIARQQAQAEQELKEQQEKQLASRGPSISR